MNNYQTSDKLREMRLNAMAELHTQYMKSKENHNLTTDEYLALLVDHEWEDRQNKKIDRLYKTAYFRQKDSIEEINFNHGRNLDKNMFLRLASLDFTSRKENIIMTGPSGTGKSYLAQALIGIIILQLSLLLKYLYLLGMILLERELLLMLYWIELSTLLIVSNFRDRV